jgi:hypothetical protein
VAARNDEPSSLEEDRNAREPLAAYESGEALSPDELKHDLGIV